ncbi:MAG: 2-C-methyl-D-erythritol 4-phosphate cytidylyltransferase [Meiothermus sp.]|nr:2-C-methyl-D-erythritol 4-phosphate cytidylyltransferase [Meiothermus sp.]
MKISVLLPAAGSGERVGRGPKAFIEVGGKTLLRWALEGFAFADEIVVALPAGRSLDLPNVRTVAGGATRQQSVFNLVEAATADVVLVHDVARPFVVRAAVERLLEAVGETGAATLAVAVPDTLVRFEAGRYGAVTPRDQQRLVQTPQGFRRELLWEAHKSARAGGLEFTDDAQVVMYAGHPVALVEGDRRMFKVTYPEDLDLAEGLARGWRVD